MIVFAIAFFFIHVPFSILLGWYDYKYLSIPVDKALGARASPWNRDLAKALILMAKGKNKEAIKILEKWTKEL